VGWLKIDLVLTIQTLPACELGTSVLLTKIASYRVATSIGASASIVSLDGPASSKSRGGLRPRKQLPVASSITKPTKSCP
jgi:hypothetical protein